MRAYKEDYLKTEIAKDMIGGMRRLSFVSF